MTDKKKNAENRRVFMGKQINEREVVLEILMEITENGAYSHKILGDVLSKYQYLEKRERAFITRVVEGTLEHMIEIDYILNQISKTKVKKMKPVIRNLLRSSVYQLKYMDSVPDHAVCSEAVKLAVRKGFSGLRGYVNGVLRNVVRKMDEIEYPKEDVQRLSVKYSVPEWILSLWKKEYGEEITEREADYDPLLYEPGYTGSIERKIGSRGSEGRSTSVSSLCVLSFRL